MPKQNIAERVLRQKTDTTKAKKMSEEQGVSSSDDKLTALKENLSQAQKSVFSKCKEKLPFMNEMEIFKICLKHDFNSIIVDSIVEGLINRSQDDEGEWFAIEESAPKRPKKVFNEYKGNKVNKFNKEEREKQPRNKNVNKKEERPEAKTFKPKTKNFKEPEWIQKDEEQKNTGTGNVDANMQKNIEKLLEEEPVKNNYMEKIQPNGVEIKQANIVAPEEPKYTLTKKASHEEHRSAKKKSHEVIKEAQPKK